MKKTSLFILPFAVFALASCNEKQQDVDLETIKTEAYNLGYKDGQEQGYRDGYDSGSQFGYNDGYNDGLNDGYEEGYSDGSKASQSESYNAGYKDGYIKGLEDAIESLTTGVYPGINIDTHTGKQANYLAGAPSNISSYAAGTDELSKPLPITLRYGKGTATDTSTYKILVSENADLTNAWTYTTKENHIDVYNCKLATKYYWKVSEIDGNPSNYPTFSFTTKDTVVRNLNLGTISNARDLGNFVTDTGAKTKQGLVYRTAGLNWKPSTSETVQPSQETLDILTKQLGVKTDIDLASRGQVGTLNRIDCKMEYDQGIIGDPRNDAAIKKVFQTFADSSSYPLVYHCTRGRDRTGAIGFVLEALLGVSEDDMYRDFLFTNFGESNYVAKSVIDGFKSSLNLVQGATLKLKAENYLKNLGITDTEISNIRSILLEN